MTNDELRAALEELGVEYSADAKKAELQALLDTKVAGNEPETMTEEELDEVVEEIVEEAEEEVLVVASEGLVVTRSLSHDNVQYVEGDTWPLAEMEPERTAALVQDGVLK